MSWKSVHHLSVFIRKAVILLLGQNSKLKFDIPSILFFLDYVVVANRQVDKKDAWVDEYGSSWTLAIV